MIGRDMLSAPYAEVKKSIKRFAITRTYFFRTF